MNILISTSSFGELDQSVLERLDGFNVILNPYKRTLSGNEIKELLLKHEVAGLIAGVEPITGDVLRTARKLKVISRCGSGMDSIDLKAANELGMTPGAVRVAKCRVLQRLREELADLE